MPLRSTVRGFTIRKVLKMNNEILKWGLEHPEQAIGLIYVLWGTTLKIYEFFKDLSFKNIKPKLFEFCKNLAEKAIKEHGTWDKIPENIKNNFKNQALDFVIDKFPVNLGIVKPLLKKVKDIPTSQISMFVESVVKLAVKPYIKANGNK